VGVLARLLELDAGRRIEDVRGQLQRSEPGSDAHEQRFAELLALEDLRRSLRQAELSELVDSDGDVHAAT